MLLTTVLVCGTMAQLNLSAAAPTCYGARVATNNDLSATSLTVAGASSFALDLVLIAVQEVDSNGKVVNMCTPPCYQTVVSSSVTNAANDSLSIFSIVIASCFTSVNVTLYTTDDVATLAGGLTTAVQANEFVLQAAVSGWSFQGATNALQVVFMLDFHGIPVTGSDVNQTSPGYFSMVTSVDSGVFTDSFVFPLAIGSITTPSSSVAFNGSMITIGAPPNVSNVIFQAGMYVNLVPPVPEYQNYTAAYVLTGIAGGIVLVSLTLALVGLVLHLKFVNDSKL